MSSISCSCEYFISYFSFIVVISLMMATYWPKHVAGYTW